MKNTTDIKQNRIEAQKGMALFTILAVFIIVVLLGNLTFMSIHLDLKHTDRELKKGLRDYAGDAALHWGLFLTQKNEFSCATHDSTGTNPVDTSINCEFSLSDSNAFYPGRSLAFDSSGWITTSPGSEGQSLTGTTDEVLSFKVWYPNNDIDSVRITGRAVIKGKVSEVSIYAGWN